MKILLINSPNAGRSIPEEEFGLTSIKRIFRGEPLGLETLAGNLVDHEVAILDLKVEDIGVLPARLRAFSPDVVGISAMTCEANAALAIAATVKRTASGAITVIGGAHASNAPDYFNEPQVDYICMGLGKLSFAELVAALEQGQAHPEVPGIARAVPGEALRFTPRRYGSQDLVEALPPRYDLVADHRDRYVLSAGDSDLRVGFVVSAHGCPYRCNFCSIETLTGGKYVQHQAETVIRDLRLLGEEIAVVRLVDANSFGNRRASRALGKAIAAVGIQRRFIADVRADTVVREPGLIAQWAEIGLGFAVIGFESIDNAELARLQKQTTVAVYLEAIRILHDLNIKIIGDFIVSPDYTHDQFDRIERFIDAQAIDLPVITVLTPLPGTHLHRQMRDRIRIHSLDYYTLTNAVIETRLPLADFYARYARLMASRHAQAKL